MCNFTPVAMYVINYDSGSSNNIIMHIIPVTVIMHIIIHGILVIAKCIYTGKSDNTKHTGNT